jgi:hypothetical protein
MDKAEIIDALWGKSEEAPPAGGNIPGFGGNQTVPGSGEGEGENKEASDPRPSPADLWRENSEGDAPASYEPVLNSFFNGREYQARFDKDDLQVESLSAARTGASVVLRAFEVGETGAKEIFNLFGDYIDRPDSDEVKESKAAETSKVLSKEWGKDTAAMISAAKKVLAEASRKIPNLLETVERTGLGNDAAFIRRLAQIGARKGFNK